MNNKISLRLIKERFNEFGLEYETIDLQNGFSILCSEQGGRIFGPFENDESESIFWISDVFANSEIFGAFLKEGGWNLGGDRVWISPEIPFFTKNKEDFFNTYTVQKELDPGSYKLIKKDNTISMFQNVTIESYADEYKNKKFSIGKNVFLAEDPLRVLDRYSQLSKDVKYCGFQQNITLNAKDEDKSTYLETWVLTQINPSGTLVVPFLGDLEFVNYYEPISQNLFRLEDNHINVSVTGDVRYKLGFKAAQMTGRAGYFGKLGSGSDYLLIRNYYNNPSNVYCSGPYRAPHNFGCSMFLYNDSGSQGGFAEFENSGKTISGDTGLIESIDNVSYYLYVGNKLKLNEISNALLGVCL